MKPRTKMHHRVLGLSKNYLFNVENKMLSWAKVECLDHKGYATKSRVICMDCGNTFSPTLVSRKRAVCPHCNTKIKVEQSRKSTDKQKTYIAIAEICDEFQVIRNFELFAYYKVGKPVHYFISEILQHWILPNGKREVVARRHTVNWYCDSWGGYMEIQNKSDERKYDVYPQKFHPDSIFKTEYQKYGINHNLEGLTFLEAVKIVPDNSKAETLLKAKRYDLLGCYSDYNLKHGIYNYWSSIKICLRNKYKIKDIKMWFDYLDLLQYLRKDLHNAFYVCPKNLKKEHDLLVAKKKRQRDKEDAELKREKLLKDEKVFLKLKAIFSGIVFTDGKIKVRVLESVKEHIEEGDALHHCVSSYALKEDSLILSAKIRGKRIETVEVSLKKLKVVQCRGLQNKNTEYHDRIIELVNKNMHLIKERLKPKRKKDGTKKNVTAAA
ncbi:hypothetical protein G7050_02845 [Dysgonomonas sp. HDW5A]|uniref:PcfJ domain-containing protein n=1 Tax=Dysgonomonas sp. HDW5A TaxID=2714926 RepID=UPI001408F8A3|nr:PcfJ domain-containing protein [Dysgonomonas sp. HDW5A]QIK58834.1 hypothetical protein G7050_02845 [Dysgonomonas sp. HDW5A]